MILHNISQKNVTGDAPTLRLHTSVMQKESQKQTDHMSLKSANHPAATFKHASEADYTGKKLTPLQRSIVQLQEQITKAEANDKMSQEAKEDLLKSLNEQLKAMEEQLTKEQQPETTENKDKKPDSNPNAAAASQKTPEEMLANAVTGTLLTAADGLKAVDASSSIAKDLKIQSDAMQRSVNNGIAAGWIGMPPDPDIMSRRQGEVDALKAAAQSAVQDLGAAIGEINEAMEATSDAVTEAKQFQTNDQNASQPADEKRESPTSPEKPQAPFLLSPEDDNAENSLP